MRSIDLPAPSNEALAHSARLVAHIRVAIEQSGGTIDFAQYMSLALYAPGLGYYSAGSRKLGAAGDFITAPELTPLFGQTLAQFCQPLIASGLGDILEVGAGSGALAASILEELDRARQLPTSYQILELSADLRERSRDTLARRVPHLLERVQWLNRLPPHFSGTVIGNEVLDAMPTQLIRVRDHGPEQQGLEQRGVGWDDSLGQFQWRAHLLPSTGGLDEYPALQQLREAAAGIVAAHALPPGYATEIGLEAQAFIRSIAAMLDQGAALFIDYGFPAREFFHAERSHGTLRCHYRHRAHDDPFLWPGLQDITSHIDFSAIAAAGVASGLTLAGYTSQAAFLLDCGLTELLARIPADDPARYLPVSNAVQQLVSPAEMGELFKAIAFTRGAVAPLTGFRRGDRTAAL